MMIILRLDQIVSVSDLSVNNCIDSRKADHWQGLMVFSKLFMDIMVVKEGVEQSNNAFRPLLS